MECLSSNHRACLVVLMKTLGIHQNSPGHTGFFAQSLASFSEHQVISDRTPERMSSVKHRFRKGMPKECRRRFDRVKLSCIAFLHCFPALRLQGMNRNRLSDRQDNLADVGAAGHQPMGFGCLGPGIDGLDANLDGPGRQRGPDLSAERIADDGLFCDGTRSQR